MFWFYINCGFIAFSNLSEGIDQSCGDFLVCFFPPCLQNYFVFPPKGHISYYLFLYLFKHQKHFILGYSRLTTLWYFQVNSEGIQLYIYMHLQRKFLCIFPGFFTAICDMIAWHVFFLCGHQTILEIHIFLGSFHYFCFQGWLSRMFPRIIGDFIYTLKSICKIRNSP